MSEDRTPEILRSLAREFDHVVVERSTNAGISHRQLQPYVGTDTWVLGVDGDELFDPAGLERLRNDLDAGAYADAFRVRARPPATSSISRLGLRAVSLLHRAGLSRSSTTSLLLNPGRGAPERLLGMDPEFRLGFHRESRVFLFDTTDWNDDPLRLLHVCFLRRSSSRR